MLEKSTFRCHPPRRQDDSLGLGYFSSKVPARLIYRVWLDGSIRTSKKHSTIMWSHMARRLVAARKSHVIFGFNTKEEKLANLYSQCNPATLYRGDSTNLQNQSGTHGSLCIQAVEIKPAVYAILKGIVRRSSLGAALGVRGLLYSNKKAI